MRVTLELSLDETRTLQEIAQAAGVTVEAVLHSLIAQASVPATAALAVPALPGDLEALSERQQEQEEVEANIKRWHQERKAPKAMF